jgi:RsiW-degrading membrane proteinase PrsW (M82 family)
MPYCASCGTAHDAGDRFCGGCGTGIHGLAPSAGVGRHAAGASQRTVTSVVGEFQRLPLATLVPLRVWWNQRLWRQPATGAFLLAALAPFLLLHLGGNPDNFHKVSWGFALYFAGIWLLALRTLIRPELLPWQLLGKIAVFTIIAGVSIAVGLEKHMATGDMNVGKFVFGVGVPEELAKAIPVYLFMYRSRTAYSLRAFMFAGAVSGLAFGAAEAVSYSTAYASVLPFLSNANSAIVAEIWRLVTDSLFHACMAAITAFFVGLAHHYRAFRVGLIGFGLAFAAVLHGLYDDTASGWTGTLLASAIVFVFVGYVATGDRIAARFAHTVQPPSAQAFGASTP